MRRPRRAGLAALLLMAGLIAGGCEGLPSSAVVRSELEREIPGARLIRDSHLHLGPVALALIKPVARWSLDEDDEARVILSGLRRVDVATYRVEFLPRPIDPAVLRRLEGRLADNGWSKIVRESDGGDDTWVFSRQRDDGSIRGLLVVELDDTELTIVGVAGRLDEVLAQAIAEEPGELAGLLGS